MKTVFIYKVVKETSVDVPDTLNDKEAQELVLSLAKQNVLSFKQATIGYLTVVPTSVPIPVEVKETQTREVTGEPVIEKV